MRHFTSALYLGMRHGWESLSPWEYLTLGTPAALAPAPGELQVARALAQLQGAEATLGPSTFHLLWDWFGLLDTGTSVYADGWVYPVVRWGIERALSRGIRVQTFGHFDPDALARALARGSGRGRVPLVVTDGFCTGCGRVAPLLQYLELARRYGGRLLIDDTQGLGILGTDPAPDVPYGLGGGGTPGFLAVAGSDVVVVVSMAKAFGAPIAALSGHGSVVRSFRESSRTRVYCSPPSAAGISAASLALAVNRRSGDVLRAALLRRVLALRRGLESLDLRVEGGIFPLLSIAPQAGVDPVALHSALGQRGVQAILRRSCGGPGPRLAFAVTLAHGREDLECVVDSLSHILCRRRARSQTRMDVSPTARSMLRPGHPG